jgi:dihydropteroate synthase
MRLVLGDRVLECVPGRPLLMGIVNVNPDSFSDARRLTTLEDQVAAALEQVAAGADLIDVGGESGVTYTGMTAAEVEAERVIPLVERLVAEGVTVSVDTFKAPVAAAALDAGAVLINDVSGLADPELARLCAAAGAGLVVMHTRAAPKEARFPAYEDVVGDVEAFLRDAVARAREAGMGEESIVVDPGPDFAKSPAQTVDVLRAFDRLTALGHPVLAAISRKYFLGAVTGRPPDRRLGATVAAALWAAEAGAAMLRVHDVAEVADALAVREVLRGKREVPEVDRNDDALKWIRDDEPPPSGARS